MQYATPYQLKKYTDCPRRAYRTWWQNPPLPPIEQRIPEQTIKYLYFHNTDKGNIPTWKMAKNITDHYVRHNLQYLPNQDRYEMTKKMLGKLSKWYNDKYLTQYHGPALIEFPIKLKIDKKILFSDVIDTLVIRENGYIVLDFQCGDNDPFKEDYTYKDILNDYSILFRIWGIWKALDTIPMYSRVIIGKKEIKMLEIMPDISTLKYMEPMLKHIIHGVYNNIYYPSYSDLCKRCVYSDNCNIIQGGFYFAKDFRW